MSKNIKTNLDHIREMDDYELASFIAEIAQTNGVNLHLCDECEYYSLCLDALPCPEEGHYYEWLYKPYYNESESETGFSEIE